MDNEGSYLGIEPDANPGSYMAVDPHEKQFVGGGSAGGRKKQPKKKGSNPGSYMAVDPEKFQGDGNPGSYFEMAPDGDGNPGAYMAVDPAGNPGSYMAVDPHAKQFVGGGSAGGRKKQPKKKGSNPGSYMAVDPDKFQGDGNPGSYFEMAPDGDDGNSYMAVDPFTGQMVKKKRAPRSRETDIEFAAGKKAAAKAAANPGSYMAVDPGGGNPGSYMAVDPADLDENSFVAVDPSSGRTGVKRRDPRTGEISWDFSAVGGQDKGNPDSYVAMEPDFELDEDMDMTQFLAKAAQQAKGDGNFQGMNDAWIEQQHGKLSKQPWYKGDIGRKDALTVLKGKQDGAFLVRASQSQPGTYACSV